MTEKQFDWKGNGAFDWKGNFLEKNKKDGGAAPTSDIGSVVSPVQEHGTQEGTKKEKLSKAQWWKKWKWTK